MYDKVPEKVNKYLDCELLKRFENTRKNCFSKGSTLPRVLIFLNWDVS